MVDSELFFACRGCSGEGITSTPSMRSSDEANECRSCHGTGRVSLTEAHILLERARDERTATLADAEALMTEYYPSSAKELDIDHAWNIANYYDDRFRNVIDRMLNDGY